MVTVSPEVGRSSRADGLDATGGLRSLPIVVRSAPTLGTVRTPVGGLGSGEQVIDGLCSVLDEHLAAYRSSPVPSLALATGRGVPAAIGAVPWLTSVAVVDRLLKLEACCIVIDRGTLLPPAIRLLGSNLGFPNFALRS